MDYMNRLKILLFFSFINYIFCEGISKSIQHGLAVCDAQKGEWNNACSRMMSILAQDYDDPQILYDAGVAAYRTGQFEQACAYFQDCCSLNGASNELKERAFFNQGNAEVEKKNFQSALDAYKQVLTINPHNQQARHNKEKVKEMLDQQEKQQREKEQQKSDAQDKQSENNNHNKEDSDSDQKNSNESKNKKENNNEKQENNGQEKKNSSEQSDDQNNGSHNKPSEKQDQNDNTIQHDQPQKQNQDKDSSGQENNSEANQKNNDFSERGDTRDSSGDQQTTQEASKAAKNQQTKHKEQEEKNEQRSSLKNDQQKVEKNERASVASEDKNDDLFEKNQAWMAQLLQEQENADKQINKKWVKATMAQSVMDNNENNSW